jgi:exosortase
MSFPSPILPANRPPIGQPAIDAPSSPTVRTQPTDEGLVAGVVRRAREFAADMRIPEQRLPWVIIGVLGTLLIYSYWVSLAQLPSFWDNPQYQHGWIVPVFTIGLLYWWRRPVGKVTTSARAAGIGLLVASFALRMFCASYRIVTIDMYTFVPALMGVFLLAGGWSMFRWSWAPLASLIFMYPLPDEATRYLLGPLQTVATILSTYALQTIGLDAYRDGNRIILGDGQVLGVVDACSGLKMLTIFVWLAVMLMLVGGLEWWENLAIAASAIPIALVCNAFRITTVGVMYNYKMSMAEHFHDSTPAAMLMMLLAVGFLVLEMKILSLLVVTDDLAPTMVGAGSRTAAVATGPRPLPAAGGRPVAGVQPIIGSTPRPPSRPETRTVAGFSGIPAAGPEEKRSEIPPPDGGEILG